MELAGFDVVVELHIDTLVDAINSQPTDVGQGNLVYLLGGRFSLDVPVDLPNGTTAVFRLTCDASLEPVVRSRDCRIVVTITGASGSAGPYSLTMLGGIATVTAPIVFAPTPPAQPMTAPPSTPFVSPGVDFRTAAVTLDLDVDSKRRLENALGPYLAAAFTEALRQGLAGKVHDWGQKITSAVSLLVVPGVDSSSPLQLSAPPQVMWIDQSTLGLFGYHRGNATGGDPSRKFDSDIIAPQEFMYGQAGTFGTVPGRRLGVLFSPEGFKRTIGCPLIASQVVAPIVGETEKPRLRDDERRVNWDVYHDQAAQGLLGYLLDEFQKDGGKGSITEAQVHRALDRVNKAAEGLLEAATKVRVSEWLDSFAGKQAVIAATPPPCGDGHLDQRVPIPDPFSDETAHVTFLELRLDQGFIAISARADCDLPVCGSVTVDQPMVMRLPVGVQGQVVPSVTTGQPITNISAGVCEVVVRVLVTYLTGGALYGFLTVLVFKVAESIAEDVLAGLLADRTMALGSFLPQGLPADVLLKEIRIEPTGLAILALKARQLHWNDYRPGAALRPSLVEHKASDRPSAAHPIHVDGNLAGCREADFEYTESWFDSTWRVDLTTRDLPLPLTVSDWSLELGNFSFLLGGVRDLRPSWSGSPASVIQPTTSLMGEIHVEEPPRKGRFASRTVQVAVNGDPQTGWQLGFSGDDGNFYVRAQMSVTDGTGATHVAETFFRVEGEALEYGQDYKDYMADCERRIWDYLRKLYEDQAPKVKERDLPFWVPIWDPEIREAVEIYGALKKGGSAAHEALRSAAENEQQDVLERVRSIPVNMRLG